MENPIFAENIPLATQHDKDCDKDNDYDDYNTPNISRVDETTFTMSGSIDKQSLECKRWFRFNKSWLI